MAALTVMTPQWQDTANDITVFIIRCREQNEPAFQNLAKTPCRLFNAWARERGRAVDNVDLALWCVKYMQKLAAMPMDRLYRAAKLDGLRI